MSLGIDLKPTGLKEALRTINSIDPKLRRAYGKQIRELGKVVVDAITPLVPSSAPMSGMENNGRTGWKGGQTKNIVVKTNTRKARKRNITKGAKYETIGTITVGTKGAALAIADMAGKGPNRTRNSNPAKARPNMVSVLDERMGKPSRMVWAGGEKAIPEFQKALEPVIKEVIFEANKELMKVKR
jgi:hypothetical protein